MQSSSDKNLAYDSLTYDKAMGNILQTPVVVEANTQSIVGGFKNFTPGNRTNTFQNKQNYISITQFGGSKYIKVPQANFYKELKEYHEYKDIFRFGDQELMIPFEKLDDTDALQSIDLTYFLHQCREILKAVYDQSFKNHKQF